MDRLGSGNGAKLALARFGSLLLDHCGSMGCTSTDGDRLGLSLGVELGIGSLRERISLLFFSFEKRFKTRFCSNASDPEKPTTPKVGLSPGTISSKLLSWFEIDDKELLKYPVSALSDRSVLGLSRPSGDSRSPESTYENNDVYSEKVAA